MNCGNNRYVELTFTQTGNSLQASIPLDSFNVLDGYYHLIAMVDDIPSISKIIKIESTINTKTTNEIREDKNFIIYPNPTSMYCTIKFPNQELFDLNITDLNGRTLIKKVAVFDQIQLNCDNFAKGVYVIRATSNKNSSLYIQKLIISN
ncbi:MAG: T9SS type A sorting domain-containing protein, partial [Saprospiraceae bacterium]